MPAFYPVSYTHLEDEKFYYLIAQIEVIEDIGERVRIFSTEEEKTDETKED